MYWKEVQNERNSRKRRNDDDAEVNNEVDEASDDAAEASKDEVSWIPQDLEDVANEINLQVEMAGKNYYSMSVISICCTLHRDHCYRLVTKQSLLHERLPERWCMSYAEILS